MRRELMLRKIREGAEPEMQGGPPLPAGLAVPLCRGKTEFGSSTVNFAYF